MTSVLDPAPAPPASPETDGHGGETSSATAPRGFSLVSRLPRIERTASTRRVRTLVGVWLVAIVGGLALVIYGLGPFFQQRTQRHLMKTVRADISRAANEATGLAGVTVPTRAPDPGAPVGVLEVGAIRIQQVVVEGVGPSETKSGPGHVPGTAGLGQPGNSVVVGRQKAFGGPFSGMADLDVGRKILVTTTQGQSVYTVSSVRRVHIHEKTNTKDSSIDTVYGPSKDDRLTLVTAHGAYPWNASSATVVVAKLDGTAFAPTPQGGRRDSDLGTQRDSGAAASIVLVLLLYGVTISASLLLYRRFQPRTAYMLTIGPILAMTIIAGETVTRALPAWI